MLETNPVKAKVVVNQTRYLLITIIDHTLCLRREN